MHCGGYFRICPKREAGAYLTVYLTLTLAVLLSLCLALIEGVRQNTVFLEAECVTDIGLNSVLAEYHRELLRQYNLFAIDSSYGAEQPELARTQQHLTEYIQRNFSADDIFLERFLYRDFLKLSSEGAEVTKVSFLSDDMGAVFRRRAAEAVWDDMNLDLYQELTGWMQTVEANELDTRDVAAEKRKLDRELDSYNGMKKQIAEKKWITIDVVNPTKGLEEKRKSGILKWVIEDPQSLSAQTMHEENLISTRIKLNKISQGNLKLEESNEAEKLLERFFFQEYLMRYMGHYSVSSEEHLLQYQIEYLIAGKENDLENLRSVANTLCAMREAANISYIITDDEKCTAAELLGDALATLMTIPEAAEVLKYIILFGWSFAESVYDVECLMKGGRVPLMKDEKTWHYDLDTALQLSKKEEDLSARGLSYEDYLRILLTLKEEDLLTVRAMNLVEADIRRTPGNEMFRLDGCIDELEACVSVRSAYGYDCEITRRKGYGTQ